jgi:chemotaxis protein methyltransferase CheR
MSDNQIAPLNDADFTKLSNFIYVNYGIKLPLSKKIMLQSRLVSRLKINGIKSYADYTKYVLSGEASESEIVNMIDLVSTNKTDFYRESAHFDFMKDVILPDFLASESRQPMKIWSSASSSGEEAYTIAIVMSEFIENNRKIDFEILGTDISSRILEKAKMGIYPMDRVDVIPLTQKKKYLLRSKDQENPMVRIVPQLRAKTRFQRLNLMDPSYNVPKDFDIIFCRNVLIYFDRETQEKVINKLCMHLKPGGYFFLGHSESISGIDVPLKPLKPTMFVKI